MKEPLTGPYHHPNSLDYDEGWAVFETEREDGVYYNIQRLDSPSDARPWHPEKPLFESDEAAVAYVRKRAEEGSQYHKEALAMDGIVRTYGEPDPRDKNVED